MLLMFTLEGSHFKASLTWMWPLIQFKTIQTSVGGVPRRREHLQCGQPLHAW